MRAAGLAQPVLMMIRRHPGAGGVNVGALTSASQPPAPPASRPPVEPVGYRPNHMVQILGRGGNVPADQAARLTADERQSMGL